MDAGAMYHINQGYAHRSSVGSKPQSGDHKASPASNSQESLPGDQVELNSSKPKSSTDFKELAKTFTKEPGSLGMMAASNFGLIGGLLGAFGGMSSMALLGGVAGATVGAGLGVGGLAAFKGSLTNGKQASETAEQSGPTRTRNADGRFRTKSGKTKLETLRGTYGLDFAAGLPGNMPLGILRAATGESLTQLLKNPDKIEAVKPELENWQAPDLAPGGRTRNADGRIRAKSGKTKIDTLRGTYGLDFAAGLPGNMPLQVLRATTGESLSQLLKNPDKIEEAKPQLENWSPGYPSNYDSPSITAVKAEESQAEVPFPAPSEGSKDDPSATDLRGSSVESRLQH